MSGSAINLAFSGEPAASFQQSPAPVPQVQPRPPRASMGADALLTGATNLALALVGLVTGILAARLLGPHGRGELAAIQTWANSMGALAMLGMGEALVYFSAREPERAGRYVTSAALLALFASLPFMAAGYLAMPTLLSAEPAHIVAAARFYLLLIPLFALVGLPYQGLRGVGDFKVWNPMRLSPTLIWLAILVAAWVGGRAGAERLADLYLLGLALLFFPVAAVVATRTRGSFRPEPRTWGAMLSFGMPCVFATLPQMLNLRMDQMLMAAFLPARELGLYVAAVAWAGAANPIINAVGMVIFPMVASHVVPAEAHRVFARGARAAAMLAAMTGALLLAATPIGFPILFGAGFKASIPAALILVPAGAVAGINSVLSEGLRGLGAPSSVMVAELCGLMVTVAALAILLRPLGIAGAALASLMAYSTTAAILIWYARKRTGLSMRVLLVPGLGEIRANLVRLRAFAVGSLG